MLRERAVKYSACVCIGQMYCPCIEHVSALQPLLICKQHQNVCQVPRPLSSWSRAIPSTARTVTSACSTSRAASVWRSVKSSVSSTSFPVSRAANSTSLPVCHPAINWRWIVFFYVWVTVSTTTFVCTFMSTTMIRIAKYLTTGTKSCVQTWRCVGCQVRPRCATRLQNARRTPSRNSTSSNTRLVSSLVNCSLCSPRSMHNLTASFCSLHS